MKRVLRECFAPRYAALTALMVVVAVVCVAAGTWQIARYDGKHLANTDLRQNARDTPDPVADVLPLTGQGAAPDTDAVEFRPVTATGIYDVADQMLLRRQSVDDQLGYTVVTPLTTADGVVLVARGFVATTSATLLPATVPAPPSGQVTVVGRVQPGTGDDDKFALLGNGQIETVNPTATAGRLGTAVRQGYVELEGGQPGTEGLTALPAPDLGNPAGGAFELQHLAYVVQWYLFAALALAAPVAMVRADRKRLGVPADGDGRDDDGHDDDGTDDALPGAPREQTAAERLAERYGR